MEHLPDDFFATIFRANSADPAVVIEHALVASIHSQVIVASTELDFQTYAELGHCALKLKSTPRPILTRQWGGEESDQLVDRYEQSFWTVLWEQHTLQILQATWSTSCGSTERSWVIAADKELADSFILDVARKTNDPGQSMLVFRNGHWSRSKQLYETVQRSSFDDLIVDDSLKSSIRADFSQFLGAQEKYSSLGLSWRRGALFIGPPGNGKTHCIRALVKELAIPSLYVQSLSHQYYESEQLLQMVFDRARELRPCVLVLEDLDALVNQDNQSFFLNQLDGFEKNVGLVVLATTNHPERIDAAIINRPSRFDRKYHFGLPSCRQRSEFLKSWRRKLSNQVDWSEYTVEELANNTEGFSFAYLKELVVSALLGWMSNHEVSFDQHVANQRELLSVQMVTPTSTVFD